MALHRPDRVLPCCRSCAAASNPPDLAFSTRAFTFSTASSSPHELNHTSDRLSWPPIQRLLHRSEYKSPFCLKPPPPELPTSDLHSNPPSMAELEHPHGASTRSLSPTMAASLSTELSPFSPSPTTTTTPHFGSGPFEPLPPPRPGSTTFPWPPIRRCSRQIASDLIFTPLNHFISSLLDPGRI